MNVACFTVQGVRAQTRHDTLTSITACIKRLPFVLPSSTAARGTGLVSSVFPYSDSVFVACRTSTVAETGRNAKGQGEAEPEYSLQAQYSPFRMWAHASYYYSCTSLQSDRGGTKNRHESKRAQPLRSDRYGSKRSRSDQQSPRDFSLPFREHTPR